MKVNKKDIIASVVIQQSPVLRFNIKEHLLTYERLVGLPQFPVCTLEEILEISEFAHNTESAHEEKIKNMSDEQFEWHLTKQELKKEIITSKRRTNTYLVKDIAFRNYEHSLLVKAISPLTIDWPTHPELKRRAYCFYTDENFAHYDLKSLHKILLDSLEVISQKEIDGKVVSTLINGDTLSHEVSKYERTPRKYIDYEEVYGAKIYNKKFSRRTWKYDDSWSPNTKWDYQRLIEDELTENYPISKINRNNGMKTLGIKKKKYTHKQTWKNVRKKKQYMSDYCTNQCIKSFHDDFQEHDCWDDFE